MKMKVGDLVRFRREAPGEDYGVGIILEEYPPYVSTDETTFIVLFPNEKRPVYKVETTTQPVDTLSVHRSELKLVARV